MICGKQKYHNQYMDETDHWVTDLDDKAICTKDKVQILEYCHKVYPKKDITNIVESSHYFKIENWCKVGQTKCKVSHWVKPFRCLEGSFQSDALLVPEHCLFDHIHNQSKCQGFDDWNRTAARSCVKREMQLRSFAMLLPCGIDIFSGVEFVCCPNAKEKSNKMPVPSEIKLTRLEKVTREERKDSIEAMDDDDSSSDSSSSEEDDDSDTSEEQVTPSTPSSTPDYYYSHFDAKREHEEFKAAEKRLEETHREKVTKVMKDWSELEERYQEMKAKDPKAAESFKKKMTARFQKTVAALEEEGTGEKHQLVVMHQQRVMAHINEKKKEGMECYSKALNANNPKILMSVLFGTLNLKVLYDCFRVLYASLRAEYRCFRYCFKAPKVQKCLEKLLRALEKDRMHTINHYKHLLNTNLEQANKATTSTLEHLMDLNRNLNQSLEMLDRIPDVSAKIKEEIVEFLQSLRGSDDPLTLQLLSQENEETLLEKFKSEVAAKQQERQHEKELEKQRKHEKKVEREERKKVISNLGGKLDKPFDPETMEDESIPTPHVEQEVKVSHAQKNEVHHNEASFSVKHEDAYKKKNSSVYVTLAFAGIALVTAMIVGIVFLRKRSVRSPHHQGFVEVDQAATPEERHVANMQVNGYENPTYKYFETRE
uniref:Beta-amyloid-like protein n=1 Tax=Strigamia maritima TaxID=126957 RepID=T1JN54_STRMM